ncbi:unnamed protein product [Symbiodinium sp. KB8]|nr:unnamed protein product [Symbiodinium sp. KB8]
MGDLDDDSFDLLEELDDSAAALDLLEDIDQERADAFHAGGAGLSDIEAGGRLVREFSTALIFALCLLGELGPDLSIVSRDLPMASQSSNHEDAKAASKGASQSESGESWGSGLGRGFLLKQSKDPKGKQKATKSEPTASASSSTSKPSEPSTSSEYTKFFEFPEEGDAEEDLAPFVQRFDEGTDIFIKDGIIYTKPSKQLLRRRSTAVQASVFGSGPGRKRTYEQQCLLAASGREARARRRAQKLVETSGEALQHFADDVNERVGSRCPKLKAVLVKGHKQQNTLCSTRAAKFVFGGGNRSRQKLTATEICEVSFDKRHNRSALADQYQCSPQTIRRCFVTTSQAVLETQLSLLKDLRSFVLNHKPDVAAACIMFDETGQTLALDAIDRTSRCQQRSTWNVRVGRLHFTIGYLKGPGVKLYREVVFPPLPLSTNSAESIFNGLFQHPLSKPLFELTQEILAASRRSITAFETDGHLANEKLYFHLLNESKQEHEQKKRQIDEAAADGQFSWTDSMPRLSEQALCQNHQVNLVFNDAIRAAPRTESTGGDLIPNLYAGTLFLRMGGHFLRLIASLRVHIESPRFFQWRQNPSQADLDRGRAFRNEVSAYLKANLRHHDRQMAAVPRARDWVRLEKEISHCFDSVLNGCGWDHGVLVHQCVNSCCKTRREAQDKVLHAATQILFRVVPCLPLTSDWTKIGPCLDAYISMDVHGLLGFLLQQSAWAHKLPQRAEDEEADAKVDWRALAGRRFHRFCKVMSSHEERFQRVLLAIAVEPLRHLHSTFLAFAHSAINEEAWPLLLRELWAPSSKYISVMQYYSTLLAGQGSRLCLLAGLSGHDTVESWILACPGEASSARNRLLMIAASLHRRYETTVDRYPWRLYSLADPRCCSDHERICAEFFKKPACCHLPGVAREIREALTTETFQSDLPSLRWLFLLHAMILKFTVASVERRHATHKSIADPGSPWYCFAAESVLAEARHQAQAAARLEHERELRRVQSALDAGQTKRIQIKGDQKEKRPKAKSPLEIFRADWLRAEKERGRSWNPGSRACWQSCRQAFENLVPDQVYQLELRAQASKLLASVARKTKSKSPAGDSFPVEAGADASGHAQPLPGCTGDSVDPASSAADPLTSLMQEAADGALALAPVQAGCFPGPPVPKHLGCNSLQQSVVQQASRSLDAAEKFPITPSMIKSRMSASDFNLKRDVADFARRSSHIASGPSVPDKVLYPGSCGALCRTRSTVRTISFHEKLVSLLHSIVKECSLNARRVADAGVVLVVQSYLEPPQPEAEEAAADGLFFFAVACSAGRQARVVAAADCVGQTVEHKMCCCTEDELAARACFAEGTPVEFVRICRLEWVFAGARLDAYEIRGVQATYEAMAEPEAPTRQQRQPVQHEDEAAQFDMLEDLLQEHRAARRKQARRQVVAPVAAVEEFDPLERDRLDVTDADARPRPEELEDMEADAKLLLQGLQASDDDCEVAEAAVHEVGAVMPTDAGGQIGAGPSVGDVHPQPPPTVPQRVNLESLPIFDQGCWHYVRRSDGSSVGRLHHIATAQGACLKATCKLHKSCHNMISLPQLGSERLASVTQKLGRAPQLEDIEMDLVQWLSNGLGMTATQHDDDGRQMRATKWDVKIRAKR